MASRADLPRIGRTAVPRLLIPAVQAAAMLAMATDVGSGENTGDLLMPLLSWMGLGPEASDVIHGLLRALGHLTAYALFAVLVWWAFEGRVGRVRIALLLAFVLAALDESVQALVATRQGDPADVVLDAGGAAFGLWLVTRGGRRRTPAALPTAPSSREP